MELNLFGRRKVGCSNEQDDDHQHTRSWHEKSDEHGQTAKKLENDRRPCDNPMAISRRN